MAKPLQDHVIFLFKFSRATFSRYYLSSSITDKATFDRVADFLIRQKAGLLANNVCAVNLWES